MATEAQIEEIMERLKAVRGTFMSEVDKTSAGMGFLLRYLAHRDSPVSAGEISASMQVSTARVAVLLKSMDEKGLIVRHDDPADARKTLVSISDKGKEHIACFRAEMEKTFGEVIDELGYERLIEFINTANDINGIVSKRIGKCEN